MSTVNDKTPSTPPAGFFYRGQMSTHITREDPLGDNPYLAGRRYTYGYATDELQRHSAYLDVLLLLLRGELPDREECQLLEGLLIGLSNPGPNHPAVRAAMTAGLSKTNVEHLLPVGLLTGGGACSGAAAAADAWKFIKSALTTDAKTCAERLLTEITPDIIAPGFGRSFGQSDPLLEQLANALQTHAVSWPTLAWGAAFVAALA
ncbi:MAG TPA: hypothetical protein VLF15_09015, partial [Pseudoxanthomonas sp.]|nr:hypothetical protein [Pseudoxanthomonas sp.]